MSYLQQKADLQLEARIDINNYDESQLIEIRTSLQLPYQTTWEQYERCYGNIEIDGKSYTYVKRKIADGYMILKCIPNTAKEVIKSTEQHFLKASQGIGQETDKASSFVKAIKCYIGDFDQDKAISGLHVLSDHHHTYWPSITAFEERGFVTAYEHPPESSLFI